MTVARLYRMTAKPETATALRDALIALAAAVETLPGCHGAELLHDQNDPTLFIFIEKWESVEAHKGAGKQLPKAALAPVMAALAGPPDGAYLDYLLPA